MGEYVAGDLGPRLVASFESHLAVCRDCDAFLRTYKKTIELTRLFLRAHEPCSIARRLTIRPEGAGH